jgi:uncharacterized protein (DUF58 family)
VSRPADWLVALRRTPVTPAFPQANPDCPFHNQDASLPIMPSLHAESSKNRFLGRLARWLQSPSAEVWARFLLALVGLALAFATALFSTVSRDAGNIWATVILASISLILAALVGLVTVPYLARRVALERLRESLDFQVNRVGIVYVLVTIVISIAALNTGNNLLYIVVAAMLSAIIVSGIASAIDLRYLELDVRLPQHVFAGRAVPGRILVRNPRRYLPSFSIRVVPTRKPKKQPEKQWRWEEAAFTFPFNRPPEQQWFRIPDLRLRRVVIAPEAPGIFDGMAYFPFLPPGCESSADLELKFERRGRYRDKGFGLATRFPFSFLTKTRHLPLQREVLVYPKIEPTDDVFEILPLVRGEWQSFVRGRGSDLYRIREYMPEDSARHVDWKATAKSGSLKVREFSREDERKLCIVFDNPPAGTISEAAYERAVDLAASLAWHFSEETAEVSFLATAGRTCDLHEFLAQLAVVEPRAASARSSGLDPLLSLNSSGAGEYNIILTARSAEAVPSALRSCSYFVFLSQNSRPPADAHVQLRSRVL